MNLASAYVLHPSGTTGEFVDFGDADGGSGTQQGDGALEVQGVLHKGNWSTV